MKHIFIVVSMAFSIHAREFKVSEDALWRKKKSIEQQLEILETDYRRLDNEFYLTECRSTGNYGFFHRLIYSEWVATCRNLRRQIIKIKKEIHYLEEQKEVVTKALID